jgi:hypothetical protein
MHAEMHPPRLPGRRAQQGRVSLPRSLRLQVLRGQRQGQREDAGRGCWEAGRRWDGRVWDVRGVF